MGQEAGEVEGKMHQTRNLGRSASSRRSKEDAMSSTTAQKCPLTNLPTLNQIR